MVSTAASPGAPAGPVLVAAKLHVPALRAGMVSRGELVGRLVGAGDCKLVLVCAPAGWGKTSVLSQWHSAEPGVFAWVSLDPGDDDRVRFWSYLREEDTLPRPLPVGGGFRGRGACIPAATGPRPSRLPGGGSPAALR